MCTRMSLYSEELKGNCKAYSISLKGEVKLKKVKNKLSLFNQPYRYYILGADWLASDGSD
ncbi:MAG: hypothetical protein HFJ09_01250 [Lachnospiraceae bacterium]|nr:hypothetical protein [Lachnospiraceae bacterium]